MPSPDAYGGERFTTTRQGNPTLRGLWGTLQRAPAGLGPSLTAGREQAFHAPGAEAPSTDVDAVHAPRPTNRARRFDRQLWAVAAFGPGEPRAAQLPHHDGVAGELALEPRGWNRQFRVPSSPAKEACRVRELGGGKWLREAADRDQVLPLTRDVGPGSWRVRRLGVLAQDGPTPSQAVPSARERFYRY